MSIFRNPSQMLISLIAVFTIGLPHLEAKQPMDAKQPITESAENLNKPTVIQDDDGRPLLAAQFIANGTKVATLNVSGLVSIWDVQTNQALPTKTDARNSRKPLYGNQLFSDFLLSAHFSVQGDKLVTGSETGIVRLFEIPENANPRVTAFREIAAYSGKEITLVRFSPDGKYIVAVAGKIREAKIYTTEGTLVRSLKGHMDEIVSVDFSPNSKKIATASMDGTVRIWDVQGQGKPQIFVHKPTAIVEPARFLRSVAFSPNGKQIAMVSEGSVYIRNLQTGKVVQAIEGTLENQEVAFSPTGENIVVVDTHTNFARADQPVAKLKRLTVFEVKKLRDHFSLTDGENPLTHLSHPMFSLDSKKILASSGNSVYIWNVVADSANSTK